jgi:hypothetical protein
MSGRRKGDWDAATLRSNIFEMEMAAAFRTEAKFS